MRPKLKVKLTKDYLVDGHFPWHLTRDITFVTVAWLPFAVNGVTAVTFKKKSPVIPTTALPAERGNYH